MRVLNRASNGTVSLRHLCGLWFLFAVFLVFWFAASVRAADRAEIDLEAAILRVKPGVVLISSEVDAEVTLRCGSGPAKTVTPDPQYETGSGFIIHPDGYIATNGHVVARFYEMNERMLGNEFLETAANEAYGESLAGLTAAQRNARLRAIVADPANRRQIHLTETLQVHPVRSRAAEPPRVRLQVAPDGEVVAVCDCPDEGTSAQVALQLLAAGYRHVSVVRGGLHELMAAGVPVTPKAWTAPRLPLTESLLSPTQS